MIGMRFSECFVVLMIFCGLSMRRSAAAQYPPCDEMLKTISKSNPVYEMLSTLCDVVNIVASNFSMSVSDPESSRDERLVVITALKHEIIVMTELIAGEKNFSVFKVPGMQDGIYVDYDSVEGYVYWAWEGFHKARLDGKEYKHFMNANETCEGLTIDWVARNLYWVEYTNKIKVSRMNGSLQKTLVGADDLDTPRGIAVDPLRGKLYWGEWGFKPRIASAWMDGTNSKTLVDEDIMWPNGKT
ncbi:low-density lipoprotein receptor-like [Styela clava]